jgi:chromosome partitioning protein
VFYQERKSMAKTIAISNQKGGVGKTTTAVNLSASLAAFERKVLLIDLDPQGNASQGLGYNEVQEEDVFEALDAAENPQAVTPDLLKGIIKPTGLKFMNLIPSSPGLAGLEMSLVTAPNREGRLQTVVNALSNEYEFIIIDSPPSLNLLTINALTAADTVLIPVQCEYYAMQGLAELFNTIRLVQKNFNSKLQIEGALLTMYDARLTLSKQVMDEVKSCFSEKIFKTIIPRNVKLAESPSHGKPVIMYDIQSVGSKSYIGLAEEILGIQGGVKNG